MTSFPFEPTGRKQFISGDRQISAQKVMDKEVAQCVREKKHYWLAIVSFKVNPPLREGSILDSENMRGLTAIGCYICEEPFTEKSPKRCPGEPRI